MERRYQELEHWGILPPRLGKPPESWAGPEGGKLLWGTRPALPPRTQELPWTDLQTIPQLEHSLEKGTMWRQHPGARQHVWQGGSQAWSRVSRSGSAGAAEDSLPLRPGPDLTLHCSPLR